MLTSVQDMLRRSKPPSTRRSEIQQLYQRYLSGTTLSATNLLQFLHKEQMELTADEDTAKGLIHRYEIEQSGKQDFESCEGSPISPAASAVLWIHCQLENASILSSLLPPSPVIEAKSMTFEGFFRYMESQDCCVFNQAHTSVYQDMAQPLSSYFISTSHNTYLTGDQIVGKSHLDAYVW